MSDKGKLQDRLQAYIALYSNATNKSSGGDSVNGGNDDRTCNLSHISLQDEDSIRHFQSWLNEIQKTLPPSELILSNCNLSDYSIQMILKTCMYSNMNLRYIDLSFNHMYIEGTLMLIECMQRNKSIESVNIFANDIFHASHSLRKEYANQSGENKSLTEIESILQDVVAAFKESQYVRSICGCRILHPSLRFNLSHTSNIEMEFLIAELAKNMDLKHAMISVHNSVGHHEEHHLLEKLLVALEKNRTLMSLSLQDIYSFQYKIMQHIADASVNIQHSTLKTLQLHFANNTNNLNNNNNSKYNATSFSTTRSQLLDFFKWLLENLLVGTKLTTLQFDSIPVNPTISEGSNMAVVDDALWDAVCELVSQNKTIIHFAVYNTVFNLDQWSRLLLALEKNTSIKVLHIGGKQASASEQIVLESNSFRVLQEIVDKRQANLIMR